MYWGQEGNEEEHFFRYWRQQIHGNDPHGFARANHDIHIYMLKQLAEVIYGKKQIGQAGWSFRSGSVTIRDIHFGIPFPYSMKKNVDLAVCALRAKYSYLTICD